MVWRVHDEDVPVFLVQVGRDVEPVDRVVRAVRVVGVAQREGGLEVLEEPGLDGAHEGLEVLGIWLGPVVEDLGLEREAGLDLDPPGGPGVVALPRDMGEEMAGDGEDVGVEPAPLEAGRGREGADPVPVADPVLGGLGLGVPVESVRMRWRNEKRTD